MGRTFAIPYMRSWEYKHWTPVVSELWRCAAEAGIYFSQKIEDFRICDRLEMPTNASNLDHFGISVGGKEDLPIDLQAMQLAL